MHFIAAHSVDIIAVIMLLVAGTAIGNYACSVVYRLPRGQTPFEKHPYCGSCGTMLKPIDLFPVLSFLMTRGRCRYCASAIPAVYTLIEIACAVILIGYYFTFGIGAEYIVYTAAAVFIIMAACIAHAHGFISSYLYSIAAACLLLGYSVNHQGDFLPALLRYIVLLVLALSVHALACKIRKHTPDITQAHTVWWLALLGLIVPFSAFNLYAVVLMGLLLLRLVAPAHVIHTYLPCVLVIMIGLIPVLKL